MENNISKNNVIVPSKEHILKIFPRRIQDSNKGTYGHVLNIMGSSMYPGAAHLASLASLKVGAGYSMLASTSEVVRLTAAKVSDLTYFDLGQSDTGTIPKSALKSLLSVENADSVAIGCGLGLDGGTVDLVVNFLKKNRESTVPFVIDADGLNACASKNFYDFPFNTIITPHPMELARLVGVDVQEIQSDRVGWAKKISSDIENIVVLKGHHTVIATPNGKVYVNDTGNSALSKAGTGDILTGMIAGFLASGVSKENAAVLAVFIHGVAGEMAAKELSEYGMLASDLLKYIPYAMRLLIKGR